MDKEEFEIERYIQQDLHYHTSVKQIAHYFIEWEKKRMIDAACEILRINFDFMKYADSEEKEESFINRFRQAMNEEK